MTRRANLVYSLQSATGAAIRRTRSFSSCMRGGLPTTASTGRADSFYLLNGALAGHHDDWRLGGFGLDRPDHTVAINIRHAQISNDHFVRLVFQRGGAEQFQPDFSARGNRHPMFETRETLRHDFPEQLVVINAKDVQGPIPFGLWLGAPAGSIVNLNASRRDIASCQVCEVTFMLNPVLLIVDS